MRGAKAAPYPPPMLFTTPAPAALYGRLLNFGVRQPWHFSDICSGSNVESVTQISNTSRRPPVSTLPSLTVCPTILPRNTDAGIYILNRQGAHGWLLPSPRAPDCTARRRLLLLRILLPALVLLRLLGLLFPAVVPFRHDDLLSGAHSRDTLFPYTTLFRSHNSAGKDARVAPNISVGRSRFLRGARTAPFPPPMLFTTLAPAAL